MNLQSRRRLSVWFAAVVISAIIGVSGYLSMRGLLEANRWTTHTRIVLAKLAHLLSVVKDAETGQRGYVLYGQPSYLEPYHRADALSHADLGALKELTQDNPAQQESLVQLGALTEAKLARLHRTIEIRDISGLDAAVSVIRIGQGKRIMDDLRALIATMQGREQALLQTRSAVAAASWKRAMLVIAIVLPLLAILAILLTRRSDMLRPAMLVSVSARPRLKNVLRYSFPLIAVSFATVLRWRWALEFESLSPFILFFPAVLIVASVAGSGPGLVATILSSLAAAYFFLKPRGSIAISSPSDLLSLAIFTGTNVFTCILAERLLRSRAGDAIMRESEQRFRTMVNAIPQLACIARADGYIYWYNQRWYEYTGTTPRDMEGWGWQSVHDQETLPAVLDGWKASIATGEPFEMVFPLRGADGRFRSFLTRVQPLKDSQGRVVQWFGTNTDVEELKRAEEAGARLAAIVESSDDAILSKRLDGTILTWNAAAERLFGYRADDIIGKPISQLVPPERTEEETEIIARLRRGEACEHIETVRVAKDGRQLDVSVTISPLKDRDGTVIGASKIARDISERKRAEEALSAAMKAANVANRAKSDFLANMSHEMRTPMNAIMGFAETMVRKDQSTTRQIECAKIILHNSAHLLELINGILDLAKIDAGQMTVDRIACDLPELLLAIISQIRPKATESQIGFEVTFAGPIPRVIQTDPLRLRQILLNLLGNAVKFTKSGKIELRISDVGAGGENIALRMDVIDSGIGITPEQLEHLFRPFMQGDTSVTREFGGTGLGLTISRQLAKLLRGDVTVTSTVGVGSRFTLTMDGGASAGVERLQGLSEATLPTRLNEAVPIPIGLSGRILLVDDGPANQRLMRMQLGDAGAEVVSAENGQIAVDLATTQRFDLILMDMQMPVMDGYAATTELRRRGLTTPIVALTASAMATDRENCMSAGCSDYLSKPINRENLLRAVKRHLRDSVLAPAIA